MATAAFKLPTLEEQLGEGKSNETSLYEGQVLLRFNPKHHTYEVEMDGESWKTASVTTILNVIDKSNALIPWAVNTCLSYAEGKLVEALVHDKANAEAIKKIIEDSRMAHRKRTYEATDIGSLAHAWLELAVPNKFTNPKPENAQARACCEAAEKWFKDHHVKPLHTELKVYSRKYDYAGTVDLIAMVDGVLSVLDYKSSKAVYDQYWLQTAAYVMAWEEQTGNKQHVEQRIILKLGKTDGTFEPHYSKGRDELTYDFTAFRGAQILQDRLGELNSKKKLTIKDEEA